MDWGTLWTAAGAIGTIIAAFVAAGMWIQGARQNTRTMEEAKKILAEVMKLGVDWGALEQRRKDMNRDLQEWEKRSSEQRDQVLSSIDQAIEGVRSEREAMDKTRDEMKASVDRFQEIAAQFSKN